MTFIHIESRHKEFFGLVCYHEYFTNRLCTALEIEPTEETKERFRNYYLIFKPLPFGFLVTYSPDETPQRLKHSPEELRFSFWVKARDSRFVNFSQIPFQPVWKGFHFSNMEGSEADLDIEIAREVYYYFKQLNVASSRKKLLHLPQYSEVKFRPRKFLYDTISEGITDSESSYNDLVILDEWGKANLSNGKPIKKDLAEVRRMDIGRYLQQQKKKLSRAGIEGEEFEKRLFEIQQDITKELASQNSRNHQIDLRHAPFGKYNFSAGQNGSEDLYISEKPEERLFGMIDIHLDPKDGDKLVDRNADDGGIVNPKLYHLHFEARKTHWRYFFMNHKQSRIKPKLIKEENELLKFSMPEATRLQNLGVPALLAVSEDPIPLSERPKFNLMLERQIGKRPMKDIKLPVPSIDIVRPTKVESNQVKVYSDVYVYL